MILWITVDGILGYSLDIYAIVIPVHIQNCVDLRLWLHQIPAGPLIFTLPHVAQPSAKYATLSHKEKIMIEKYRKSKRFKSGIPWASATYFTNDYGQGFHMAVSARVAVLRSAQPECVRSKHLKNYSVSSTKCIQNYPNVPVQKPS